MFNLFRSQKQAVKLFLGAILMVVAVSMIVTLIPGGLDTGVNPTDTVLAEVGGLQVTIQDVQAGLLDYSQGGQVNGPAMSFLGRQVVDNQISNLVLLQEASDLGLSAGEEELASWLKQQMPFLFPNGVFLGTDQYRAFVAQRFRKTVPQFEEEVRRSLMVDVRLKRMVTDNVIVTDEELKDIYRRQNDKTKIEFVKIQTADFNSQVTPTGEQISELYESQKQQHRVPETRSFQLMVAGESSLPPIELSDAEIERYYRQNRQRFEISERIRASHILFTTEGKSDDEKTALQEKAQGLLAEIKAGADFTEMAKTHSQDAGTAPKGGDLGWIMRGQMVPSFEKASFALQPSEISDVITTDYGFHIINVHERENSHIQALDEVRDTIRQEITQDRSYSTQMKVVDEAIATARRFGADMESAGAQLNLPVRTLANIKRGEQPPGLEGLGNLLTSVFSVAVGEVVTSNQEGKTSIAVVTEITESRQAELSEVRGVVEQQYVQQESRRLSEERAKEVAEAAKEGKDLNAVARRYRLKTAATDFVARGDSIPELGAAQLLGDEGFTGEPGTIVGPVNAGGDWVIYTVVDHQDAEMFRFDDERTKLLDTERTRKQDEIFNLFKGEVQKRFEADGKIKRYETRIENYLQAIARSG
jgi:peptidyl-prolyl cis-trans isomerase D